MLSSNDQKRTYEELKIKKKTTGFYTFYCLQITDFYRFRSKKVTENLYASFSKNTAEWLLAKSSEYRTDDI